MNKVRVLVAAVLLLVTGSAWAQFPERPIRMLYGFPPGGSGDIIARLIAEGMTPIIGQRIMVENRTGANGALASEAAARSVPDGHTVLLCSTGNMTIVTELPGMRLPVDPARDLTGLALVARTTYGFVVPRESRWRSVGEIIEAARAEPGKLSYASPGIGSVQHLSSEYLKQRMDVNIVHVPYRGSGPAILDMVAGRSDFMITNLGDMMGQIRNGDLRLLALGDPLARHFFAATPLVSDAVPGFETNGWFALCGPTGMPASVAQRWQDTVRRVLTDRAVQQKLLDNGLVATFQDAAEVNQMMDESRRRYREIIRAADIRAE